VEQSGQMDERHVGEAGDGEGERAVSRPEAKTGV